MTDLLTARSQEGVEKGKARRAALPRKALAVLGDRPGDFDPISVLELQGVDRVQSLLPLRYSRMAVSEFSFLRGAAAVMAYDLGITPATGIDAQLCGDAHISNFGIFFSTERRLIFDVNDFDETLPGPFEWDVKRMLASAAVAMSSMNFSDKDITKVLLSASATYRNSLVGFSQQGNLDVWYAALDVESKIDTLRALFQDEHRSPVDDIVARAKRTSVQQAFAKLTTIKNGHLQFKDDPPLIVSSESLAQESPFAGETNAVIAQAFEDYISSLLDDRAYLMSTYERVDMARKVVGVGSVGTRCFISLFMGRSYSDPFILQIKEASPSVLESHLGPSHYDHAGERVVAGQRLMQTTPDMFLGYTRVQYGDEEPHDFYFRQFHDGKASVDISKLTDALRASAYIDLCAWTLARAHARSGDRMAIATSLGDKDAFDKAMTSWALAYVERNRSDYGRFLESINNGRLPATTTIEKT